MCSLSFSFIVALPLITNQCSFLKLCFWYESCLPGFTINDLIFALGPCIGFGSFEVGNDFKRNFIIKDNDIWGDYLLLNQFINTFQLNILILNVDTIDNQFYVYNTLHKYNTDNKTIILNYINEMHFTLVGYFDSKKMVSLFTHDILPEEISILFTPSNILNRSE